MVLPIVAARCRCSLAKIRRARTHCKLLRRLPYVPRPPVRFRILRRAVGGLADVADGAARSKDSEQSVCSCLLRKCRAAGPKDDFRPWGIIIIRPCSGVLHAPVYFLAASQWLARGARPLAFPLHCASFLQDAAGGFAYCSLCGGATGKADALHRAVRVLKQPLQKHCLPAWPPMVLSYLECHTGNHGLASNRQFEVLCRMQRFARRGASMFSPLLGASAAPVHRLYQYISWLLGGSF